ncbi:MAG: CBS domain-containing protein [Candidatus Methylomirabilales bacterium]
MTLKSITAGDIMTSPVYTVGPDDPVARIIALLCTHRISGVPVVDTEGHLMGLVSERDILNAMHPGTAGLRGRNPRRRHGHDLRDISGLRARDIMSRHITTASPETEPLRLASMMALRKIRRIPIVAGRKLVGIVSHGDVYRAIFEVERWPLGQRESGEETDRRRR